MDMEYKYTNTIKLNTIEKTMTAKLTFQTREQAQRFCTDWAFKTLKGHSMTAGKENVIVTVYGVTELEKEYIEAYIYNANIPELTDEDLDLLEELFKEI